MDRFGRRQLLPVVDGGCGGGDDDADGGADDSDGGGDDDAGDGGDDDADGGVSKQSCWGPDPQMHWYL